MVICVARNPKQDANLEKGSSKQFRSGEEAARNGRKGGKASGRSRRALKSFKEVLTDGLTKEEQEIMMKALKRNAMRGNLPSMEFLLKMLGQHPDQGDQVNSDIHIIDEDPGGGEYNA